MTFVAKPDDLQWAQIIGMMSMGFTDRTTLRALFRAYDYAFFNRVTQPLVSLALCAMFLVIGSLERGMFVRIQFFPSSAACLTNILMGICPFSFGHHLSCGLHSWNRYRNFQREGEE
jgi:hypothetical protein